MSIDQGPAHTGEAHVIARFSGRLHAALDRLVDAPAWSMTADEQRRTLVELAAAEARLAELRLRVLAAGDASDIGKIDASSSTPAWVAHATRQERPAAHRDLRLAKELDDAFTATRDALAAGTVNRAQAEVVVHAVKALPDRVTAADRRRAEAHLLAEAAHHDAHDLRILGRRLFEVLDPDAADEEEGRKLAAEEAAAARATFLRLRDNGDGTHGGAFRIPDLHAQMLKKMLAAFVSPRRIGPEARHHADGTPVPGPELLGRAFCELIERYPADRLPYAGGVNATVVVTMTLEQIRADLAAASLDTGAAVSAALSRRLACEAGIIPAVLGKRGQPLDLGRRTRLHTESQRIAVIIRDQGCTAETCDRPASMCHVHHEVPWSRGGRTDVATGRLLCPWHHGKAHDPAYRMTRLPGGKVRFSRRH